MKAKIAVRKKMGQWTAYFTIGNQTFDLAPIHPKEQNEKMARWQAEMLRSAFGMPRIGDVPENADDINEALDRL